MNKRPAVIVAPAIHCLRILARPPFQPPLLLGTRNALVAAFRIYGRLEMVGNGHDQVHRTAHRSAQSSPGPGGQYFSSVYDFLFETHLRSLFWRANGPEVSQG